MAMICARTVRVGATKKREEVCVCVCVCVFVGVRVLTWSGISITAQKCYYPKPEFEQYPALTRI